MAWRRGGGDGGRTGGHPVGYLERAHEATLGGTMVDRTGVEVPVQVIRRVGFELLVDCGVVRAGCLG